MALIRMAVVVLSLFALVSCDAFPDRAARQANEVNTAMTGIVELSIAALFPMDVLQSITGRDEIDDSVDIPCEEGIIRISGLEAVDAPVPGVRYDAEAINCAYPIDRTTYIFNGRTAARISATQKTGRVFIAGRLTVQPGAVVIANGDHGESASTSRILVEEIPAVIDVKNLEFNRPGVAQADDISLSIREAQLSLHSRADYMRPVGQRIRVEHTDITFKGQAKALTFDMFARITYRTSPEIRITLDADGITGIGGDICPFDGTVRTTGEYGMTVSFGRQSPDREVVVSENGAESYVNSCQQFFSHAR